MKKLSEVLMWFIRIMAIILIVTNILRLIVEIEFLNFLQDPEIAIFNSILLLVFSYLKQLFQKANLKLGDFIYIVSSISIILTFMLGMIFGLLQKVQGFDKFSHLFNGVLLMFVGVLVLSIIEKKATLKAISPTIIILFAFFFTATVGVLWEIFEYLVDLITKSNMQRFKDLSTNIPFVGQEALKDTMNDFIFNTIGSLIGALVLSLDFKGNKTLYNHMLVERINNEL